MTGWANLSIGVGSWGLGFEEFEGFEGFRVLELGIWVLEFGAWNLGLGIWDLEF